MRFHLAAPDRARTSAKTLRKLLHDLGCDVSLGACQAAVAQALGYATWAELKSQAGKHPASPFDHESEPGLREARRARQAQALADAFGLDQAAAEAVAGALGLTASRLAAASPAPELTVEGFIALCAARVSDGAEGTTVLATLPMGGGRALRFEAALGQKGPFPPLRLDAGIMPAEEAAGRPVEGPEAPGRRVPLSGRGPQPGEVWRLCLYALGFVDNPVGLRSLVAENLGRFLGRSPTQIEGIDAARKWLLMLADAGVRSLDGRIDTTVLPLFDHAGAKPTDMGTAYLGLSDLPGNARMRALVRAFPMLAYEIWNDPGIRAKDGPATSDELAGRLETSGLDCGLYGRTGPLPRQVVDGFRDMTDGGPGWTPEGVAASLRLFRARGGMYLRFFSGERVEATVAVALAFARLNSMWRGGSILDAVGAERLNVLLDGPPWRVTDGCREALDQDDLGKLPDDVANTLAKAAGIMAGRPVDVRNDRLDPKVHGPHLMALLEAGSLGEAVSAALRTVALASIRGVRAPVGRGIPGRAPARPDDALMDDLHAEDLRERAKVRFGGDMEQALKTMTQASTGAFLIRLRDVDGKACADRTALNVVAAHEVLRRQARRTGAGWCVWGMDPAELEGAERWHALEEFADQSLPWGGLGVFVTTSMVPVEEMFPADFYQGAPVQVFDVAMA